MGKSRSSAPIIPAQPSPQALANAQAEANRITQFTPGGNLLFGQFDAETGEFAPRSGTALRVQETPAQSALRQLEEIGGVELASTGATLAGQLPTTPLTAEGLTARPEFDLSGVSQIPQAQDRGALEQRIASRGLELLRPELERTEERLAQDLANRGIPEGSEQFIDIQDRYARQRGDLLSSLAFDAIAQAEAQEAAEFGRGLTRRGLERQDVTDRLAYQNQLRQAELGERQALRQQAQNELTGMLTGQMLQTPALGNFVAPAQIDVLTPYNMQQQNALARAQLASQDRAARYGALGSLAQGIGTVGGGYLSGGGTLAGKSDYRIKENIDEMPDGALDRINALKPKTYNYREGFGMETKDTSGFLAHEVQEVMPEYVFGEKDSEAIQMIDVLGVLGTLTKAVQELSDKVDRISERGDS
tara:strand:- start:645 stop:1898 length:1254 start_codon:yes stop_codon:yes gene_type:complete